MAWLALAAMALIVLMPAISRSTRVDMAGMGDDCPMHAGSADHPHRHVIPGDPSDPTARCGYCVLLTQNPATGLASVLLRLPVERHAHAPQVVADPSTPFAPLLSAAPRGPPLGIHG